MYDPARDAMVKAGMLSPCPDSGGTSVLCPECGKKLYVVDIHKHNGADYGIATDVFFSVLWYCKECKAHEKTTVAHGGIIGLSMAEEEAVFKAIDTKGDRNERTI